MPELIALGETMAAFASPQRGRLRYQRDFTMRMAGAESNTAIGVRKLGHSAGFITSLGEDEFGDFILGSLQAEGVDTSRMLRDPDRRTGIMFKETSGSGTTKVFYYREGSAASAMTPGCLDADYLSGARLLHLSGITPVLSESCRQTVTAAIATAHAAGVKVSFDPNIRKRLWKEQDYRGCIRGLCAQADVVLLGIEEAALLYDCTDPAAIAKCIFGDGRTELVAVKDGANGAWCFTSSQSVFVPPFPCQCVDPVGAGDAFNAGLLCGLLEDLPLEQSARMAGLAGAMATEGLGDTESLPLRCELDGILQGLPAVLR